MLRPSIPGHTCVRYFTVFVEGTNAVDEITRTQARRRDVQPGTNRPGPSTRAPNGTRVDRCDPTVDSTLPSPRHKWIPAGNRRERIVPWVLIRMHCPGMSFQLGIGCGVGDVFASLRGHHRQPVPRGATGQQAHEPVAGLARVYFRIAGVIGGHNSGQPTCSKAENLAAQFRIWALRRKLPKTVSRRGDASASPAAFVRHAVWTWG